MKVKRLKAGAAFVALSRVGPSFAADREGGQERPLVSRYPGQELRWQTIDNYREFPVSTGPVTAHRSIDDWIDTQGRVVLDGIDFDSPALQPRSVEALDAIADFLAENPERDFFVVGHTDARGASA